MLANNLKYALRALSRNKFHALLNIMGLAIGLACTILILLYLSDELSFDKHHENYSRIYRLESDFNISGRHDKFAITSFPIGPALKLEYPEVIEYVRMFSPGDNFIIKYEENSFSEKDIYFADSTIFNVFTHAFISGSPQNALTEPNSMVLTASLAKKLFGDEEAINKMVQSQDNQSFRVTAVIEDLPANSHLRFIGLLSMATVAKTVGFEQFNSLDPIGFWNVNPFTYLLLTEGATMEGIYEKYEPFNEKYIEPIGNQINATFAPMWTRLDEIHLGSQLEADLPTGNRAYIYIFSSLALFILLLAIINYMNMATARSEKRARETGIRKVAGAYRVQLVMQFLSESVMVAIFAMLIAITLAAILLPYFNILAGKMLLLPQLFSANLLTVTFIITLIAGLLAGVYPAFYLSSFKPVTVLKGSVQAGRNKGTLRKLLVTFQFIISIVMIIATLVVTEQLKYLQNKDLGYDKNNIVVIELQDTAFIRKVPSFRDELLHHPEIVAMATSTSVPGDIRSIQVMRAEQEEQMVEYTFNLFLADYDFMSMYGLALKEGRWFDREMGTDLNEAVVINETAARRMGWGDDALGKKIDFGIQLDGTANRNTKVIGVLKDFHFTSLHNDIEPITIFLSDRPRRFLSIRIAEDRQQQAIALISEKWMDYAVNHPLKYEFLEEILNESYSAEASTSRVFTTFSVLSVFIALMGLLGLSSYLTERRTKEIGIRKVHGATVPAILTLLYREFALLLAIAFVVATPVAWWLLTRWLQDFAFHTSIKAASVLLAALITIAVTWFTVSYHSYKAAVSNPVDAIKYE
ncbi:MAG: ABC transporter permease [Bacteroidales bacterium]|nr:ABC transporter permease [Bacteroidales bacterium]